MKKKLSITVFLLVIIICYFWLTKTDQLALSQLSRPQRVPSSNLLKSPSNIIKQENNQQPWEFQLENAGLTTQKIQALHDLYKFHQDMPEFNQENKEKREGLFAVLNDHSEKTVQAFNQFMQKAQANDDALRTFILNVAMELQVSDEDRAELIITRAKQGAHFNQNGAVEDNELSLLIGFSHLIGLEDEQVKQNAIDEIYTISPDDANYQKLLKDYFTPSPKR